MKLSESDHGRAHSGRSNRCLAHENSSMENGNGKIGLNLEMVVARGARVSTTTRWTESVSRTRSRKWTRTTKKSSRRKSTFWCRRACTGTRRDVQDACRCSEVQRNQHTRNCVGSDWKRNRKAPSEQKRLKDARRNIKIERLKEELR